MNSEGNQFIQRELCIKVDKLGKCYQIYANPKDRLKQALVRGRRKYFREFWALRDVSLEVERGECLAIIGRNGSGKSTLLQMICGTLAPTQGSIQTNGTIAALLELGSGFNPEFTGIENVFLNASLFGLSRKQIESRLDDIQAFADIGDFISQPVKTYSSGMLVRLAFAVIAHVEPSVLIVDEALSVGDAIFGQRCMRFIRRFTENGTLLFVSHDLNAVSSLCERALWIDSGRLRMDAETSAIVTAYTRHCTESSQPEVEKNQDNRQVYTKSDANKDPSSASEENEHGLTAKPAYESDPMAANHREMAKASETSEVADWQEGKDYGNRHARITSVQLLDGNGVTTGSPMCGQKVRLVIKAYCEQPVENFMAGFIVRNKTGMILWGENNIMLRPLQAKAGETVDVSFVFIMPYIAPGAYSISAAISEGDPDIPIPMHYKPDVFIMEPILGSRPIHGVFATTDMVVLAEVTS
jgi:lipopolysaccharide transport system ATP-binding protein